MAWARALLPLACCLLGATAYQELLIVRKPDKNASAAWPVEHTEIDFLKVVQESLSSIMDRPSVLREMEEKKQENPTQTVFMRVADEPTIEWKVLKKESNAGIFLDYPHGCETTQEMTTSCKLKLSNQKGHQKINLVHAMPFTANETISFRFSINSYFVHQTVKAKCAACGKACGGKFMGRNWTVDMPECPVPAGTWSLSLPFLSEDVMEELPPIPKFSLDAHIGIHRPGGRTAVAFEGKMQA